MKEFFVKIKNALEFSFAFLFVFWVIEIFQTLTNHPLSFLGVLPRNTYGLLGVLTSPLIHGSWEHLLANSLPFLVLTSMLFLFYDKRAFTIFILIWLTSGLFTWIIGRPAWHIGASSVIYGMASFLFFGGLFSWKFKLILPAIVVIIFYSGLVWGVFPMDEGVSWEGHLSGAVAGLMYAYLFRKNLRQDDL